MRYALNLVDTFFYLLLAIVPFYVVMALLRTNSDLPASLLFAVPTEIASFYLGIKLRKSANKTITNASIFCRTLIALLAGTVVACTLLYMASVTIRNRWDDASREEGRQTTPF